MTKFLSIAFFVISCHFTAYSQCTHYTEDNSGLASGVVPALAIAPNGDIWAGTSWAGISIFDGNTWENINEFNSDLPSDYIKDIKFDSKGNAWVATGYGLAKYNGSSWTVYDSSNTIIPGRTITAIGIDPSDKIWIASRNGSFDDQNVVTFDGTNWQALTELPTNAKGDAMNGFLFDGATTWIASEAGVLKYENDAYTFYPAASTGLWSSDALVKANNGDIWFAGFHGLLKYAGNKWTFIDHVTEFGFVENTPYNNFIPDGNNLWISYYDGLMYFNTISNEYTLYNPENSCLPEVTRFNEMVRDSDGMLWIASLGGIIKFDPGTVSGLWPTAKNEANITIYPNPTTRNSYTSILLNDGELKEDTPYKIIDFTGKEVTVGMLTSGNTTIELNGLPEGTYVCKFILNNSTVAKQLIIK